ncbi:MAG TPA: AAC(3) family N-acetyltransferase [Clostridia bacterium]|nr:AAC(3) family N-acetyltransferase [Clostridia bacterium]
MPEKQVINKTTSPITIKSIEKDLKTLGIKAGDIILVHASLSSIGWVCGGAQSVIDALINVVGEKGTLVMPSHSGELSDPNQWNHPPVPEEWYEVIYKNMPGFDPDKTPTRGMGKIAELFRRFPNVIRSNHPQVSFSAYGKVSKEITKNHPLTPQFGMDSPLGKLYSYGSKVLLLGVGYDACTSFHLSETIVEGMHKTKMGTSILVDGVSKWQWFKDFDYDSSDFKSIGKSFEEALEVRKGKIGNAKSILLDMNQGVDFACDWLSNHRFSKEFK